MMFINYFILANFHNFFVNVFFVAFFVAAIWLALKFSFFFMTYFQLRSMTHWCDYCYLILFFSFFILFSIFCFLISVARHIFGYRRSLEGDAAIDQKDYWNEPLPPPPITQQPGGPPLVIPISGLTGNPPMTNSYNPTAARYPTSPHGGGGGGGSAAYVGVNTNPRATSVTSTSTLHAPSGEDSGKFQENNPIHRN
jgi:hypothetical protein